MFVGKDIEIALTQIRELKNSVDELLEESKVIAEKKEELLQINEDLKRYRVCVLR